MKEIIKINQSSNEDSITVANSKLLRGWIPKDTVFILDPINDYQHTERVKIKKIEENKIFFNEKL